ncbi:SHOCT domain-containing protein [Liquorilactobacillus satsumensis]|uniref:SHOCT domain-containing protein n=1 Tax=Liquorilactobacillus satsumensis TaxID=259059 RepID=UPI00345D5883
MNIKRIVIGAVQLLLAFITYDEASTASKLFAFANSDSGSFAATSGIIMAFACAVTGIILIVTSKQDQRWVFWTVLIITLIFGFIAIMSSSKYFQDLMIFAWGYIILTAIALFRFSKKSKQQIKAETKSTLNKVSANDDSTDELIKMKKLFDDGVITQEEFEAKKKQLLKL